MRVLVLFLVALMTPAMAGAAAPGVSVRMIEPRSFGYLVGDVFRREVDFFAAEPYRLEPASLPAPGRQTYWLDLKAVDLTEKSASGGRRYDLHRAFDASAGRRVLAEDVPIFIAGHQVFEPLASDISRFFATSRRAFFGNDLAGAAEDMPLTDVATLGKRLGEAERRAA